ncbi:MAG TPA: DUF6796 family protein [Syntrophomonas sp.]|nr:DUF6796 family protein [Syntrophomonas sp.]
MIDSRMSPYKRWLLWGIFGAVLMGSGDWLLGYVNPVLVGENPILRAGYAEGYALWRPIAAMVTGGGGAVCYLGGLWGMSLTLLNSRARKAFRVTAAISLFGWLLIHYFFCQLIYQYAWISQSGSPLAYESTAAVYDAFYPTVGPWYLIMAIPFVLHFVATLRGRSALPRWTVLLHPVPWMVLAKAVFLLLPETAFTYGLRMGSMSETMLIWFITALGAKKGKK